MNFIFLSVIVNVNCHLKFGALYHTNLSPFSAENCFEMLSVRKSGKFQMAIHIDYDREENKIELILDSQGNVISTLVPTMKLVSVEV